MHIEHTHLLLGLLFEKTIFSTNVFTYCVEVQFVFNLRLQCVPVDGSTYSILGEESV
jgi:hypothetical protein